MPADDPYVCSRRVKALEQAARWLLGRPATVDDLLSFLRMQQLLADVAGSVVSAKQKAAMFGMCLQVKASPPQEFNLVEPNSPGVLVHWKVVLLIAATLSPEERGYWRANFSSVQVDQGEPEAADATACGLGRVIPIVIDSHFHLDRTLGRLRLPANGTLRDILQAVPVPPSEQVSVTRSVAVYCDPKTYPSPERLLYLEEGIAVAVGIHPRHASSLKKDRLTGVLETLKPLLDHPRVKAVGEVGLDRTEPVEAWSSQLMLLERVLPLLKDGQVLVLHCRGVDGDCGTEAFLQFLCFTQKYVRPHQRIHLHCFTGNQYVVDRWLKEFPNTFFGFANKIRTFSPDQVEALKSLREDRLLLESDAPYFSVGKQRTSTPGHLLACAKEMAKYRELSVDRVCKLTESTAHHVY